MKKYIVHIIVSSFVALGLYFYLYFSETSQFPNLIKTLDLFLINLVAINILGFILPFVSQQLNTLLSWKQSFGKRFIAGFISNLLGGYAIIFGSGLIVFILPDTGLSISGVFQDNLDLIYKLLILNGVLLLVYTLFDLAYFSYRQYAHEQLETIRETSERLQLQLMALKKQLSPHFLFNSLNTASSLIYRNTDTAEKYIRSLSDSYRKILDSVYYNLIPLSKELAIIDTYKYLMEIRYEKALKIDISIPENLHDTVIPPLSLQLLVENAVKHNLINDDKPLYIEIYSDHAEYITVANNLNDKAFYIHINNELLENPERKSSGIGLQNIKTRYAFFSKKPVKIEKQAFFKVQLPIIKRATSDSYSVFGAEKYQKIVSI